MLQSPHVSSLDVAYITKEAGGAVTACLVVLAVHSSADANYCRKCAKRIHMY